MAAALGERGGLYQRFVASSFLDERRLYVIRANVLVTPLAERFLAAHRVVGRWSADRALSDGFVRDPRPFLVKRRSGQIGALPPDEEAEAARAALAIARGFSWAAAYGYECGPPRPG